MRSRAHASPCASSLTVGFQATHSECAEHEAFRAPANCTALLHALGDFARFHRHRQTSEPELPGSLPSLPAANFIIHDFINVKIPTHTLLKDWTRGLTFANRTTTPKEKRREDRLSCFRKNNKNPFFASDSNGGSRGRGGQMRDRFVATGGMRGSQHPTNTPPSIYRP